MRVSVIIPTYNRSPLLRVAIDSVLGQTYQDFEIIVVDDGSSDDTAQWVSGYSDRITYIRQQNAGVNAARNRALQVATGEYIALLDDDDLWFDFKLDLQVAVLDCYPDAGFVFSDFLIRKDSGQEIRAGLRTWHTQQRDWDRLFCARDSSAALDLARTAPAVDRDFYIYRGDIYHASLFEPYVLPSTALIRRRCLDPDIRFIEHDPTCGDWDFFSRLSHRHSAAFMDMETAVNRSHEDAVRLTRLPQTIQTERRIGLINRLWKSDPAFYAQHRQQVDAVEHRQLLKLATLQALNGDVSAARDTLGRRDRLAVRNDSLRDHAIETVIRLPGATGLLKAVRLLKRLASRHRRRS